MNKSAGGTYNWEMSILALGHVVLHSRHEVYNTLFPVVQLVRNTKKK